MVVYADTSLLTAYYCSERGSDQAQAYLAAQSNIAISWLTETELISALSKKVRARDIAAGDARKIAALFQGHIDIGIYTMLSIEASDYRAANRFIGRFDTNLRTLDALHAALALRENIILATADVKLAEVTKRLGGNVNFIDYAMSGC